MWTSAADIAEYLGDTVDPSDAYLIRCAKAADAFCRRRRLEAGYSDDPADPDAPSEDVALGATLWGGQLYRERGSADSFASFDETQGFATTGAWPRVKQLLGVGRARVDTPQSELAVPAPIHGRGRARTIGVRW